METKAEKKRITTDEVIKGCEITDDDLRGAMDAVFFGHDPIAAKNLIAYFNFRFTNNLSFNEDILHEFVAQAFEKIIAKKRTADQAFGLSEKRPRGEYERVDTSERDVMITARMLLIMRRSEHGSGKQYSNNDRYLFACGEVASELFPEDKGGRAVEKAYAYYKESLNHYPDDLLKELAYPS